MLTLHAAITQCARALPQFLSLQGGSPVTVHMLGTAPVVGSSCSSWRCIVPEQRDCACCCGVGPPTAVVLALLQLCTTERLSAAAQCTDIAWLWRCRGAQGGAAVAAPAGAVLPAAFPASARRHGLSQLARWLAPACFMGKFAQHSLSFDWGLLNSTKLAPWGITSSVYLRSTGACACFEI